MYLECSQLPVYSGTSARMCVVLTADVQLDPHMLGIGSVVTIQLPLQNGLDPAYLSAGGKGRRHHL